MQRYPSYKIIIAVYYYYYYHHHHYHHHHHHHSMAMPLQTFDAFIDLGLFSARWLYSST